MDIIFSLGKLPPSCFTLAGGKGGTLARLRQANYQVPDGFVILPEAFGNDGISPEAWEKIKDQLRKLRREQ